MSHHHERAKNMHTDRTRDDDGELRQKRGDTHIGNIEREYDVAPSTTPTCASTR